MKKLTKLFAILAVLAMGSAFLSCSNSSGGGSSDSGNNSDDGSGTSVTVPSELVGTWTGTATASIYTLYVTIEMKSSGSYTVKMWMDSSKSGTPWATSTGKLTQASSTTITGKGSDHTFAGTKITDNKWSIVVVTDEGMTCSGTIQKE